MTIIKLPNYNPCYGYGDVRNNKHIQLTSKGDYVIISPASYDKYISLEQAENLSITLPVYQYDFSY